MQNEQGPYALATGIQINKMAGTYRGIPAGEARSGGAVPYDLPSRQGDTLVYRSGRVTDLQGNPVMEKTWQPPDPGITVQPSGPPTPRKRRARGMADDSVAGRVIQHLKAHGGVLLKADITAQFGMPMNSFTSLFRSAIERGLLVKVQVPSPLGPPRTGVRLP